MSITKEPESFFPQDEYTKAESKFLAEEATKTLQASHREFEEQRKTIAEIDKKAIYAVDTQIYVFLMLLVVDCIRPIDWSYQQKLNFFFQLRLCIDLFTKSSPLKEFGIFDEEFKEEQESWSGNSIREEMEELRIALDSLCPVELQSIEVRDFFIETENPLTLYDFDTLLMKVEANFLFQ